MNVIRKGPSEVIPLIFDYRARLGDLAHGATIQSIESLSVAPDDELDIGTAGNALIDPLSELEVAVVATGGVACKIYTCTCRATVRHSGADYTFDVVLYVLVH